MNNLKKSVSVLLAVIMVCVGFTVGVMAESELPTPKICATQYTEVDGEGYYKVRFIATTSVSDVKDLSAVGFDLTVSYNDGEKDVTDVKDRYSCKYLYGSISATENGKTVSYSADKLGGKYLYVISVSGVPKSVGKVTFTVTPYITAADGVTTSVGDSCEMIYNSGKYADTVSAMSFNVYVGNALTDKTLDGDVDRQLGRITELIGSKQPDIVGFQELSSFAGTLGLAGYRGVWNDYMENITSGAYKDVLGLDYGVVGYDYGALGFNNHDTGWLDSPVIYSTEKFNLVEGGVKWPTDTPDSPSKLDTAAEKRPYTYAVLERKLDGEKFLVVNAHLDYSSAEARYGQAQRIAEFISDEAFDGLPKILMGDFNERYQTSTLDTLVGNDFISSAEAADKTESLGRTSIDFVLVNEKVDVALYEEIDTLYGPDNDQTGAIFDSGDTAYISDHNALYVEFIFSESGIREKTDSSAEYLPPVFPW